MRAARVGGSHRDALPYGGTCPLRGCDPKKALRRGAEIIDSARLLRGKGVDDAGLSINWSDLMRHKHGFTDPVPDNTEKGPDRQRRHDPARSSQVHGPDRIEIDGSRDEADRFLIATGARPRPLDFPGHEHLVDSTDFLDLVDLPKRIMFVGEDSSPSSLPTSPPGPARQRSSWTAGKSR